MRRDLAHLAQVVKAATDTIATLTARDNALTAALTAVNAKTQRVGASVGGLAVGSVDVAVSWPASWPDTAYGVWVSILSGTGALGSLTATLKSGTKTADGCTITVANTGTVTLGAFGLDVLGVRT